MKESEEGLVEIYVMYTSFFILSINKLSSDSIKSTPTFFGNNPGVNFQSISFLIFLYYFLFLELLESPSNDLRTSMLVSRMPAGNSVLLPIDVR